MARDGYTAVSSCLGAAEAEMLRGVLESAGVEVVVEGEAIAALALPQSLAAATVLVPDADAERAREIVSASGVFPGAVPVQGAEIDEAEWRAGAPDVPEVETAPPDATELARRSLWAAALALPLCFTILVPLYAMTVTARFYRDAKPVPARAHLRAAGAVALCALSLALGVAFWAKVAPDLARREARTIWIGGRPVRVPEAPQRPRPPFP